MKCKYCGEKMVKTLENVWDVTEYWCRSCESAFERTTTESYTFGEWVNGMTGEIERVK